MKTNLTVCFILFFSSLNAQVLNAGFEEWDKESFFYDVPRNWRHSSVNSYPPLQDTIAVEGDYSLRLKGGPGPADGPVMSFVQQKFLIPNGLSSISFFGKIVLGDPDYTYNEFFGYGLSKFPIFEGLDLPLIFVAGELSKDTTTHFHEFSFIVPDSLWGQETYLTFFSYPIAWVRNPSFIIDDIQLHIDSTVFTKNIEKFSVNIFPNPTSDWLFMKNISPKTKYLEVFSSDGKLVWKGNQLDKLNVSDFKSGNYFIVGRDELGKILFTNSFIKN